MQYQKLPFGQAYALDSTIPIKAASAMANKIIFQVVVPSSCNMKQSIMPVVTYGGVIVFKTSQHFNS